MDVAVLVKQVPDTYGERKLDESTWLLDRGASDAVIDEIDAKGVETALQLVEAQGGGTVTVVTMGPDGATDTLRKALAMGADKAVHIVDDSLAGSDALATSAVLAAALAKLDVQVVIAGNESTDGRGGVVPAMVAERLSWPIVSSLRKLEVSGGTVSGERVVEGGWSQVSAALPAVVTVNEKIGEPRYPNFKGIMAAKKKPVETLTVADLGVDGGLLGAAHSATQVVSGEPRPPKAAGEKITADGNAGVAVAEFLAAQRLL